ncbi:hypothetical protein QR680_015200 [Steinernema hermaphroditum]|uniref:Uncharacterized protein n=1 Tax=Steinernema hermaphroditum TaxID=289476 RepID=A0AA39IDQ3_9BILA|nr:hypothetical protein QR680_015200 [Steinernema hermaphroditum]
MQNQQVCKSAAEKGSGENYPETLAHFQCPEEGAHLVPKIGPFPRPSPPPWTAPLQQRQTFFFIARFFGMNELARNDALFFDFTSPTAHFDAFIDSSWGDLGDRGPPPTRRILGIRPATANHEDAPVRGRKGKKA